MGLNNIKLSIPLTAALYRTSLVEINKNEIIEKREPAILPVSTDEWKSLGDNNQHILIAVNYNGITHLPDEELSFLTNILSACKLNLGDIAIVNIANNTEYNYKDYKDHFKSKVMLLFGIEPAGFGLPVDFPEFQVQSVANCTFLYSPPLDECRQDSLLKSKLWVCLRRIFGI